MLLLLWRVKWWASELLLNWRQVCWKDDDFKMIPFLFIHCIANWGHFTGCCLFVFTLIKADVLFIVELNCPHKQQKYPPQWFCLETKTHLSILWLVSVHEWICGEGFSWRTPIISVFLDPEWPVSRDGSVLWHKVAQAYQSRWMGRPHGKCFHAVRWTAATDDRYLAAGLPNKCVGTRAEQQEMGGYKQEAC